IAQGRKPLTSGEDGLLVVKILEAANKSIAQGGAKVDLA
ncbi:MAG TPA: oxidoreductase, partial [Myxococcales bacterium]|nr:oxidoreductase [Myxococcales bacterium]